MRAIASKAGSRAARRERGHCEPSVLDLAFRPPSPRAMRVETFTNGHDEYMVLSFESTADAGQARREAHFADVLSQAELQIVRLVLQGLSNADIARRRGVSVQTIANQLSVSYRKLGIRSRRELHAVGRGEG
jgi:DNA-binding NarL/FixJ family response regulator